MLDADLCVLSLQLSSEDFARLRSALDEDKTFIITGDHHLVQIKRRNANWLMRRGVAG